MAQVLAQRAAAGLFALRKRLNLGRGGTKGG